MPACKVFRYVDSVSGVQCLSSFGGFCIPLRLMKVMGNDKRVVNVVEHRAFAGHLVVNESFHEFAKQAGPGIRWQRIQGSLQLISRAAAGNVSYMMTKRLDGHGVSSWFPALRHLAQVVPVVIMTRHSPRRWQKLRQS
jgi:hypothetical protein